MSCKHNWRVSFKTYKDYRHISTTYFCSICKGFKEEEGSYEEVSSKKLDAQDKRLNQTVREGRASGKNINNIRSYFKNGKWQYKYLK